MISEADEVNEARNTHEGERKSMKNYGTGTHTKSHQKDLIAEGSIILKQGIGWENMDWIHVAQDWKLWQVLMNMGKNIWIP